MNNPVKNKKIFLFLLIPFGLFLNTYSAYAKDQQHFFQDGVKAFKNKNYTKALGDFARAQKTGMKETKLYYNIAVCYYKLGKYGKANDFFRIAARDKRFRQLTSYNRGLIALKQKRKQAAIRHFNNAIVGMGNPKVNQLAQRMLDKTTGKKSGQSTLAWSSGINLALGYDDNVTSATKTTPSLQGDHYTQLFAYTDWYGPNNYVVDAYFLQLKYFDINTGDFSQLNTGIRRSFRYREWQLTPHIQIGQSHLTSASFQRQIDFKFSGKRTLDKKRYIKFRYRYTNIDSLNPLYNYLQGNRQQARADYYTHTAAGDVRLRYQLELNSRQNTATANYSPTRHSLQARLSHRLINNWKVSEELQYRKSNYASAATGVARKDNRLRLNLTVEKYLQKNWRSGLGYNYTDRKSVV